MKCLKYVFLYIFNYNKLLYSVSMLYTHKCLNLKLFIFLYNNIFLIYFNKDKNTYNLINANIIHVFNQFTYYWGMHTCV